MVWHVLITFIHTLTFNSLTKDKSRTGDLGQERKEKVLGHAVIWLEGETGGIPEAEMNKGQSSLSPAPHPAAPDGLWT